MGQDFLNYENNLRGESFRKPAEIEDFLGDLNNTLKNNESRYYRDLEDEYPIIFLVGLPRSGTTLATQLIANSFDIGYINNLIARFWMAPIQGIKLSQILIPENPGLNYQSNYGKTSEINNIHEFSYFWIKWLKMENMPPYDPELVKHEIDWPGLKKVLLNMADEFKKPLLFKAINPGYHITTLSELLPRSLFIFLDRDPIDIASSLYLARIKYYGNPDIWCSAYPTNYNELRDLSFSDQIAGQVYFLRKLYMDQIDKLHNSKKLIIKYDELCKYPISFITTLNQKLIELGMDCDGFKNNNDLIFDLSKPNVNYDIKAQLLTSLSKYNFY